MENKTGNMVASPHTGSPYSTYTSNEPRRWWSAAMECRNVDMQRLLGFNSKLVNWKNPVDGWTAMHYAAKFNNLATVKLLLRHHADVNSRSRNGQTPLHVAVLHASQLVIKFLVEECKADTSIMDFSGRLPASLIDYRLPPEFRTLLSSDRIQRIVDDLKNLQPTPQLSRHNTHHHSIKSLTGHGREFKHPLLPSMSMMLHRGNAAHRQPSTKSVTPNFLHPSLPSTNSTDGHRVSSTTLAEADPAGHSVHQPVGSGGTVTDALAPATHHSTVARRSSVWANLWQSAATAATATVNHRTSSASTKKMFRSPSTYYSCSDIRKNLPTDTGSLVSVSSNGSSTIGYSRKLPGAFDPVPLPSIPKHISANADLHLLSILLSLLPPSTLSLDSPPLKPRHKKTLSRHKTSHGDIHSVDGAGDHRKSSESVCKPDLYRSTSVATVNGVPFSRNAALAPVTRRRANSMLVNGYPVGDPHRPTSGISDSWLSQPS